MADKKRRPSAEEFEDLIRAAVPLIYLSSYEEERARWKLQEVATRRERELVTWSIVSGFKSRNNVLGADVKDPVAALDAIDKLEAHAIVCLMDFHPYLEDPVIRRRLRELSMSIAGQTKYRKHVVLMSPVLKIPPELEKDLAVVDFDLPDVEEIDGIVVSTIDQAPAKARENVKGLKDKVARRRVVDAALGLTANEIRVVLSKSLVRTRDLDVGVISGEKRHIIRKSGILEFYDTDARIEDIGGLEALKDWLRKRQMAFTDDARKFGLPAPKGILLIGVPGCGKSLSAKAAASLWQIPLLRLDVGAVMSALVGSSEDNIRKAIRVAESVAPCVLWLDELEKSLSGVKSSGNSDAGTTARVFGTFVTWLQEKTSPVFVIATANDVTALPPELLRKGRFDDIFFVDLPNVEEREAIFRVQLDKLNRRSDHKRDVDEFDMEALVAATREFSGSEIEQAIVSALHDAFEAHEDITTERIVKAAHDTFPLARTMKENIDGLRMWANGRARYATPKQELAVEASQETSAAAGVSDLEV